MGRRLAPGLLLTWLGLGCQPEPDPQAAQQPAATQGDNVGHEQDHDSGNPEVVVLSKAVVLPPEHVATVKQYRGRGPVPLTDLPQGTVEALGASCPELVEVTSALSGEVITAVVEGTEAELPVELAVMLVGTGVERHSKEICRFVESK